MQVHFHKELQKYTSFKENVTVEGNTVGDVLENVFNEFPQLLVFLLRDSAVESIKTSFKLNTSYLYDVSSLDEFVTDIDVLTMGRDIPSGEDSLGKIFVGVGLIVAAFIPGINAGVAAYMIAGGITLAVGGLAEAIIGQPTLPTFDSGSSTSSTYTFSGARNTTVSGTPLNILYGKMRIGGHLINVYTDVVGVTSWLNAQIGLCEGEIERVDRDSIKVNDRKVADIADASPRITNRLGSYSQTAPPEELVTSDNQVSEVASVIPFQDTGTVPPGAHVEFTPPALCDNIELFLFVADTHMTNKFQLYYKKMTDTEYMVAPFDLSTINDNATDLTKSTGILKLPNKDRYTFKLVYLGSWYESGGFAGGVIGVRIFKYNLGLSSSNSNDIFTYMADFNKIENTTTYNSVVPVGDLSTGGTIITTSGAVNSAVVILSTPALYDSTSGDIKEVSIDVDIYWKKTGDASYTTINKLNVSSVQGIKGKSKSEILWSYPLPITEFASYNIKVVRTSAESTDFKVQNKLYLKDVTEVINDTLIYPHTALLGVKLKATDQISGAMPTITSVVYGLKIAVPTGYNAALRYQSSTWDGQLTTDVLSTDKRWTNNPVWCLYDLLTNTRYGLGNYFKIAGSKKGIMLANFMVMAEYCDARINDDGSVITNTASSEWLLARPRFSLDIVLDSSKSAIDWINTICAVMRATVYYTEGLLWIDIDRPKPITQIFNMSNIKEFTESGNSYRNIQNAYEVQFINKDTDYEQETILVESARLKADLSIEERKKTMQLLGVTDAKQAQALAKYALQTGEYLTTTVTFKTSTYGLQSTVGDVVGVQHDVPQWGYGGNVKSYNQGTKVVTLSDTVEIKSGVSYSIQLVHKGKVPEVVALTEPAPGLYTQLTLTAAPVDVPTKGDYYVVGETTNLVKPFKVVALKRDKDEGIEVTCVEYNAQIYADADNITDLPVITMPQYSQLSILRKSVKNVLAEQNVYVATNGVIKTGATVYYSVPVGDISWNGVILFYGIGGNYKQMPIDKTGTIFIPEITEAGDYQFICISVYTDGTRQTVEEALADSTNLPFYNLRVAVYSPPTELGDAFVIDGSTSTEFVGKDAKIAWRPLREIEDGTTLVGLTEYVVRIKNTDGSLRRISSAATETYTYTHDMNVADGIPAARTFDAVITAFDFLGRPSHPVTIRVSNVAPAAIG